MPMARTKAAGVRATPKARGKKGKADGGVAEGKRAAGRLKQVSDATRLQVLLLLSEGERHVGSLCGELNQGQPAMSHHLALLRHSGIIAPRRQGKNNFYYLT